MFNQRELWVGGESLGEAMNSFGVMRESWKGDMGIAIRRKQNKVRRNRQDTYFLVCSYSRACTPSYIQHSLITHPGEGKARTHVGVQIETSRSNKKTEQHSLA